MPSGIYKHKPQQGFQKGHKCFCNNLQYLSSNSLLKRKLVKKGKHYSPKTEFKKGNIPWLKGKKNPKLTGKNHPNWQGGKSNHLYGIGWTKTLKQIIQRRDDYRCKKCGVPQEECIKTLVIHHIDYNKKNHNHNNLVTLCRTCHNKTNVNRNYWITYFNQENKNERIQDKFFK